MGQAFEWVEELDRYEWHPRGSLPLSWKLSTLFYPTRLTAPGSPRMPTCWYRVKPLLGRTQSSVPEKCSHNLCIYYPSIERTTLIRGKGQFFRVQKPGFNHDSGDTLALKKWLTTKRVDIFELMYSTHNYESFHKLNFLTWIDVIHLCEFKIYSRGD